MTAGPRVVMQELRDPVELVASREQDEQFGRNWSWLQANAPQVYAANRGQCVCIAGQQIFAGETPEQAMALAAAAHPADAGRFTLYIPIEPMARVYAHAAGVGLHAV